MSESTPTKHDGRAVLFAVAELLVSLATAVIIAVTHRAYPRTDGQAELT